MVNRYKRLLAALFLLVFTYGAFATSLRLGSAHRSLVDEKHLYSIPILAEIDGYSTFRAVLTGSDADFLAQTTSEIVKTKTGAVLTILTPPHLSTLEITARVDYQGQTASKTYRLQPANDPAQTVATTIPLGCQRQWILRGTLVSNIDRILRACNRKLGRWPLRIGDDYIDYKIPQPVALADPGGLSALLDYVKARYGFIVVPADKNDVYINFIDAITNP